MTSAYFNFFSIGMLITSVFYLISSTYCLTIPKRSKAALHLGLALFFGFVIATAYFLSATFYERVFAYHRFFSIFTANGLIIHTCQFFFYFPKEKYPRLRKCLLMSMWSLTIIILVIFGLKTRTADYVFHFSGHYWDFSLDHISKIIGVMILLFALLTIGTGIFRGIKERDKIRRAIFAIAFFVFVVTFIPAIANVLSREGAIGREIYILLLDFLSVIGYYFIIIIFINNSEDRSTFMAKLIGISIVSMLVIILGLSFYSYQVNERFYNVIHQLQLTYTISDNPLRPDDMEFIEEYDIGDDHFKTIFTKDNASLNLNKNQYEMMNTLMWDKIRHCEKRFFPKAVDTILAESHHYFAGYQNIIETYVETNLSRIEQDEDPSALVLGYLKKIENTIHYRFNKINALPDDHFKDALTNLLNNDSSMAFAPMRKALLSLISEMNLNGRDLKEEVLKYLSPMKSPGSRFYRQNKEGTIHYTAFMYVSPDMGKIYEMGFSYVAYRKFIHPDSKKLIILLISIIIIIMVGFPFFFYGAVIKALNKLQEGVRTVRKGNLDVQIPVLFYDEVGYLTHNFNKMTLELKDSRKQIEDYATNLEEKVIERTDALDKTLSSVKKANEQIMASIHYSSIIQQAILPDPKRISTFLPQSFFIWKPRDIVGGDFYFCDRFFEGILIAQIDCTGHGVPGAFMTMLVSSGLQRIVHEERIFQPAVILKRLNHIIKTSLHQDTEHAKSDDGLDASVCFIDPEAKTLTFSSARMNLYIVETNTLTVIKGDKHSIGYVSSDLSFKFNTHTFDFTNKVFYMSTDGFIDQLGGPRNKRFGSWRFKALILENHIRPFDEQKKILVEEFESHKQHATQTDDVSVTGFMCPESL